MQCLEDGYVIAHLCQIACAGKACRAGTDNSDLLALLLCCGGGLDAMLSCPVSYETLQLADGYGLALNTTDTLAFALALLGAYTSAYCGQCAGFAYYLICIFDIAFFNFCYESMDIDGNGAALDAACILAIDAACSLCHSLFLVITKAYLSEVLCSYRRLLLPYGHLL